MNIKQVFPIFVAVVLGLVAIWGMNTHIKRETTIAPEQTRTVLVAASQIPEGAQLVRGQIAERKIPAKLVPDAAIVIPSGQSGAQKAERARCYLAVQGREVNRVVPQGDYLLWNDLRQETITTLSSRLPEGTRAVTVPVDSISGIGMNIVPGDEVDIYVTLTPLDLAGVGQNLSLPKSGAAAATMLQNAAMGGTVTMLLLQDVLVLATDTTFNAPTFTDPASRGRSYSTLTFQLDPANAALLIHARQTGLLTLTLRKPGSLDHVSSPGEVEVTDKNLADKIEGLEERRAKQIELIQRGGGERVVVPE
jgi:pilus assembly protein CpaB